MTMTTADPVGAPALPRGGSSTWPASGSVLSTRCVAELQDVLTRAAGLLGDGVHPVDQPVPAQTAQDVLGDVWRRTADLLGQGVADPRRLAALVALLRDVRSCEDTVRADQAAAWCAARRAVRRALRELGDARTFAELARRAPEVAARIGFDPDEVLALLHTDHNPEVRGTTTHDADEPDLFWQFRDGLGHLRTRVRTLEALDSLRVDLSDLDMSRSWSTRPWHPAEPVDPAGDPGESVLTRRETDVVRLMGQGSTNAQIARRLVISEGTVKSHVKSILRKLRAANRAEAVSVWLRERHTSSD